MPYEDVEVDDLDIDRDSLWLAVSEAEFARQAGAAYSSHTEKFRNGEVWVSWVRETVDLPAAIIGYDRYQLLAPQGVQLGGCSVHEHWECWSQDQGPPPMNGARPVHVLMDRVGRLIQHRQCSWGWWTSAPWPPEWHTDGSDAIGLDPCCQKPFALTAREQELVVMVCEQTAKVASPKPALMRDLDLLLGRRLHGIYDTTTIWPGYNPLSDLDPELRKVWLADLALREMDL